LNNLIVANISGNVLKELELSRKAYLQIFNCSSNEIVRIGTLELPLLREFNLNGNKLDSVPSFGKGCALPALKILELRGNKFQVTPAIDLAALKTLWLAENEISAVKDLATLTGLESLHLRGNRISVLDGFDGLVSLTYLNLRDNQISNFAEFEKLKVLPKLSSLVVTGNPFEAENPRLEVLIRLPSLKKLNKDEVTAEEVAEAEQTKIERKEQADAEAAAKLAEAEALKNVQPDDEEQGLPEEQEAEEEAADAEEEDE